MNILKEIISNKSKMLFITILIIMFALMLNLNINTPLSADDYSYKFIYGTFDLVENIGDIITSQITHYFTWGGRSIVHFLVQLFLMFDKCIFNVCNAGMYIISILLIYLNITGKFKIDNRLLFFTSILFYILQPIIFETNLWLTGSLNYMWGFFFVLLCLLPFRMYIENKDCKFLNSNMCMIIMFVIGILAGWSNENTAAALVGVIITFLIIYKFIIKRIPKFSISACIGSIIGFLIMILAPGNFVRSDSLSSDDSFIITVLNRFIDITYNVLDTIPLPIIILLITYIIYLAFNKEKIKLNIHLVYILGSLGAIYSMILSPSFPTRSFYGVVVFLIIATGMLFDNINCKSKLYNICVFALFICLTATFIYKYNIINKELINVNAEVTSRDQEILSQKEDGITDVVLNYGDRIGINGRVYVTYEDITYDETHWINIFTAKYFGVDSVVLNENAEM